MLALAWERVTVAPQPTQTQDSRKYVKAKSQDRKAPERGTAATGESGPRPDRSPADP